MAETRQRSRGVPACMKVLHTINRTDKWMVSGTVFLLVIRYFGVSAVWTLLGSLVNAVFCKIAKRIINQPRPGSAIKTDPGMPSSHACSISYLSLYAALLLGKNEDLTHFRIFGLAGKTVAAVAVVSLGVFLTSLRLACGDHTWQQVIVGVFLGSFDVAWWYFFADDCVAAIEANSMGPTALFTITGAMSLIFVTWVLSDMVFGWRSKKAAGKHAL